MKPAAIIISGDAIILDLQAGRCLCPACERLDRRFPYQGWQMRLPLGSGDQPDAIPLPDLDAPAVAPAGVRAPKGRPVETRARGRKQPEPFHA